MLTRWIRCLAAAFLLFASPARADEHQGIPTPDPAAFTFRISQQVAHERMEPIRRTMEEIVKRPIPPETSVPLAQMAQILGTRDADQITKLDDVSLANTLRSIYYFHNFGDTRLFTRYDFTRESSGWTLTAVSFATSWRDVALPVTPGWTETPP
ncbi:MAG TPA: hypothetical protein VG841_15775 [Caulobacterales bacterium]|nr:hypothetical protein [Caulobacterales bacterium]